MWVGPVEVGTHKNFLPLRAFLCQQLLLFHFCKSLFEPNGGYTPGSKISTEKIKASQKDICSIFYILDLRRERKEDYMKVGESKVGLDYRIVRSPALLRVIKLISKVCSPRCTETMGRAA